MGFPTGSTHAHDLTTGQRRSPLGQTMDLTSLVWVLGASLASQRFHNDLDTPLGAEASGQGGTIMTNTISAKQTKFEQLCRIQWEAKEELRGQHVVGTLSQSLGTIDVQNIFDRVFYEDAPPLSNDRCAIATQDKGDSSKGDGGFDNASTFSN